MTLKFIFIKDLGPMRSHGVFSYVDLTFCFLFALLLMISESNTVRAYSLGALRKGHLPELLGVFFFN